MSISKHIQQYLEECRSWKIRAGEQTFQDYTIEEIEKLQEYMVDDQYISFERRTEGENVFSVFMNNEETGITVAEMQGNLGMYEASIGNVVRNNECPITAVVQVMHAVGQI